MRLSSVSRVTGKSVPTFRTRGTMREWGYLSVEGDATGTSMSYHYSDTVAAIGPQKLLAAAYYHVAVPLAFSKGSLFLDDHYYKTFDFAPGCTCLRDCEAPWACEMDDPFESTGFWLPKTDLDTFSYSEEISGPRSFADLTTDPVFDGVMLNLAQALLPSTRNPGSADALFVSSLLLAVKVHVLKQFGKSAIAPRRSRDCLAPWQAKRARELMADSLQSNVTIEEIASACGLSPAHFSRAFKNATGLAPHRWRTHCRVAKVKVMLAEREESLSRIASACGFVDQSHLTKVFSALVGATPGAWRRDRTS